MLLENIFNTGFTHDGHPMVNQNII